MNNAQIVFTAETLLEDFKTCSLEDFVFVFKQMAKGAYGSTYHQLDTSVISLCLQDHLESKAYYQERNNTMSQDTEALPDVNYEAFKQRKAIEAIQDKGKKESVLKAERMRQMDDMEYDRQKQAYRPPNKDYVINAELRRQWARENHDLITGKPNEDFIHFDEWIKYK